ncbi:MAG TPA: TonB-dependent receptor [Steroidobacteraceae bacterium]|nr:TonB-dependent receptor [Steroidobacteraceae bacterium]
MSGAFAGAHALAADASNAPVLDEIIVTAEKRSQNLQDVPISVVAISAQQIKDGGITDIRNLAILTPGLTVTSEGNEAITTARIRGIGTVGDNPGLESSVGVNIDGVYRPRNGVAFGDLGEIEQIEVLYGPQGELFGKNNDAGVINVTTKRPSNTFGAMAEVTGGNFNDREFRTSVTGPLSDIMAGRLYVGYQQNSGFLQVVNGVGPSEQNNTNDRKAYNARGQLLITPSDTVDFLLIADYAKRNESCCSAVVQYPGPFQGLVNAFASIPALGGRPGGLGDSPLIGQPGVVRLPSSYVAYDNQIITQHVRDMGISGELNWNLGFGKLTSITAWRDNTVAGGNDVDYTGIDLLTYPDNGSANSTDFKQFSEELRLAGQAGSLNWLVGGFFNNEILTTRTLAAIGNQFETYISAVASSAIGQTAGPLPFNPFLVSQLTGNAPGATFGGTGYNDDYQQTARSFALFTNETYNITQGLDLTVGLRGTEEKKSATASFNGIGGGPGCAALLPQNAPGLYTPPTPGQPPGPPNGIGGTNAQAFLLGYGCFSGLNPLINGHGFDQSNTENNLSGTVKLSYRFNEEAMVYASAANGYKAGGYNLSRVTLPQTGPTGTNPLGLEPNFDTHFPRETVVSGEVGIKTTLFDKTLRLNAAVFYQKYTDFQLNTFTGIQFVVTSLDKVVSKGVDVDFAWATPISGLTIAGGVTQDLTNIDNFGNALSDFCGGPGNGCTARDNNRLSFAPLWSAALSASYLIPFGTLGLRTSVEEKYNSSYNTGSDLDPRKIQEGFGLLNARIGFGALDESWSIEAWGANLADKYYYAVAFDSPFQFETISSYLGAPRTFGLTARVKFK